MDWKIYLDFSRFVLSLKIYSDRLETFFSFLLEMVSTCLALVKFTIL
jgi:hypothetical protein